MKIKKRNILQNRINAFWPTYIRKLSTTKLELYLFQKSLNKETKEKTVNIILLEIITLLKSKLNRISDIKIEDVYFNNVLDKNNLYNATINYCQDLNISYLIYEVMLKN